MSNVTENRTTSQVPGKEQDKKLLDQYREALRVRQFILFLYRHVLDIQLSEHRQFATL